MFIYLQDVINAMNSLENRVYFNIDDYCFYHLIDLSSQRIEKLNDKQYRMVTFIGSDKIEKSFLPLTNININMDFAYVNITSGRCVEVIDVQQNSVYILVPEIDVSVIENSYIEHLKDRSLIKQYKENRMKNSFHDEINNRGLYLDWANYNRKEYEKVAIEWCKENNINYTDKLKI